MEKATVEYDQWLENTQVTMSIFKDLPIFEKCKVHPSWVDFFESIRVYLEDINNVLVLDIKTHGPILPNNMDIFRAFELTSLDDLKVVILGSAPYTANHVDSSKPRDCGLAFSVNNNDSLTVELNYIYKAVSIDLIDWKTPTHGDLSAWAKQGVLLLNTTLTCRNHNRYIHSFIWEGFIEKLMQYIQKNKPDTAFFWWNRNPDKISNYINDKTKRYCSVYPIGKIADKEFITCKHFSRVNKYLISKKLEPIDWSL